jgi:RNA polymerase sigma factor (sigma-70 family)
VKNLISKHGEGTNAKKNGNLDELYLTLKKYCYFLTKNKWDGEDLAQQTMLKAMENYTKEITQPLLKKIAYHQWIDTTRRRKKVLLEEIPERTNKLGFESIFYIKDFLIKSLTPKQLVIYVLKEGFEYQSKEIAEILGMSEMAIKSVLFRARKQVEKRKNEEDEEIYDPYWEEIDAELLSTVIYETLLFNDPSTLIKQIQLFPSLANTVHPPKLAIFTQNSHSPTNSFYSMVA